MRRPFSILIVLLLIAAAVAIGVSAYNAGYTHGVEAGGHAVQVVRTVGPGWGFFPFGFFLFPLVFFAIFALARGGRRGPWRGGWAGHDWQARREHFEQRSADWHRRQHEADSDRGAKV